ncbi:24792_t:CDS:2, partial [Entrophospora sp. SA101]
LFDLENKGVGLNHDFNHWKFNSSMFSQGVMPLSFTPKPSKYANALFEEMSGYWMDLKPKDDVSTVVDIATWMQMIESEEFIESINTFVSDNQIMFVPKMIKDLPFIKNRVEKLLANNYMFYGRLKNIVIKRRKELEKNINNDNDYLKTKQLDLLTSLIVVNTPYDTRPQKNVNPALLRPMTDDEIRGVMFDAFVAGTDTTVNTFCFVVYYISHYPEVKKKLFEEIDSVFKDDPTREVTTTDLEKLKYCEAIIKETSRIRPTVSMLSRYSDKPDEIAGYKWPSKTLFIMYVRGINNNPLYWKDPEKFIPERFYDPEQIANQHKNSFLMFGGGPRMCLGRKVAMIELKTLLTLVYRKFDVELVDMKAPLKLVTSTITICKDLKVKLTPRELTTRA